MKTLKRLLVTGASGLLGFNICRLQREHWQIFGVAHSHDINSQGVVLLRADLTQWEEARRIFTVAKPHAVIHAAAASDPHFCQLNPRISFLVNVEASRNIARLCAEYGAACVFTSSDLVFDGQKAPYAEDAPVTPVSLYGEQKAKAEEVMLGLYPPTVVCRMPLMFGEPGPAAKSFLQPMMAAMREHRTLQLFVDEFRTPVCAESAVQGLMLALTLQKGGRLHLGGRERISRYGFGVLLMSHLRRFDALLVPSRQTDVKLAAPRPADVSLNSSKAFAVGYAPFSLRDSLARLFPGVNASEAD